MHRLIAFEGVDGVGKTLQAERLGERLGERGETVSLVREPGGTELGEELRRVLLRSRGETERDALIEAMLFSASRRALLLEKIRPARERGELVLMDRSFLSTWVYQGLVGGVPLEFLEDLSRRVMAEAWPDRILLLDLEASSAAERRKQRASPEDGFEDRGPLYLQAIVRAFRELARQYPELIRVVNAAGTKDQVEGRCWEAVRDLFPREP